MSIITLFVILMLTCFLVGFTFRPLIIKLFKEYIFDFSSSNVKRYEVTFRIEFYSQPSLHHLGEEGILVKTDPIKVQIDASDTDEALNTLDGIIKQEIKAELIAMKEIPRL